MFSPSVEQWLIISLVGLYLYDSAMLVYCNEGFLTPVSTDDWEVALGSSRFQIFGKEIFIPNPLKFHRPLFKMSWCFDGASAEKTWSPPSYPFAKLSLWLWMIALLLFVIFPLGIFKVYSERVFILVIIFIYLSILMVLYQLWCNRLLLTLSNRRFFHLAFDSLICPPFSLNLVRHVSTGLVINADLLESARCLQQPASWVKSCREFIPRIEEAISHEIDEGEAAQIQAMQSLAKNLRMQMDQNDQ